MRKLKIYLDTSVISHLHAHDRIDRMADSIELWEAIKKQEYKPFISPVVLSEISNNKEPKFSLLMKHLKQIDYNFLQITQEAEDLAEKYIKNNVLPSKSENDALHIAIAAIGNCDYIVSWNFKHLVNAKTNSKVKVVNAISGYKEISIIPPMMLIEKEE